MESMLSTPTDRILTATDWPGPKYEGTRTASDDVADQLRDLIHRGDLSPGDRLPAERQLCEHLGVGRDTIREALAVLRAQGYVNVRRGSQGGSYVTTLSVPFRDWWMRMRATPGLLGEIMEHRLAVERHVAVLAAARRTEADLVALESAVDAVRDCQDARVMRQADSAFHAALAQSAKSPRLYQAMLESRSELFVPANMQMVTIEGIRHTYEQHLAVLAAVRAADAEAAVAAITDHITRAQHDIQGSIDEAQF